MLGFHVRLHWPLARFVVRDLSMQPVLCPGDRVLVWQWASWLGGIRRGDVVVLRDPQLPDLHLVKRVGARPGESHAQLADGDGFVVLGDDASRSRDSRAFGRVPPRAILGRVVWRYLPGQRRGRVGPGGPA
jgi:signal peptidase I